MINIADTIAIDESKISFKAVRSSGPGGQHVNKVSTAIVLQYYVNTQDYPEWFLHQLRKNAGSKYSKENIITIKSQSNRSQARNKDDSLKRLVQLFELSSARSKHRVKTTPKKGAIEKRLSFKRKKSEKKTLRKSPSLDD
jgi:ribosome-associated protein|tara:strand:+ start:1492 stop:1911 length:420 start_codon:yes stop_codon:yes gene_type:complete